MNRLLIVVLLCLFSCAKEKLFGLLITHDYVINLAKISEENKGNIV